MKHELTGKHLDRGGESGMAMVETVIVLPLLLMLLFGVVEFGVAFARWQVVSNAAREGARQAILYRAPGTCDIGEVAAEVRDRVRTYGSSIGIDLLDADISVAGTCAAGSSSVTVTFRHDFSVLPNLASVSTGIDLVGSSTMRNEG